MHNSNFMKKPAKKKNKGICHEYIKELKGEAMWPSTTANIPIDLR